MARVTIDVASTTSNTHLFNKGCVLVYDGSQYHAASIDELFPEIASRYGKLVADLEVYKKQIKDDIMNFFNKYTEQNSKLIPILEELLKEKQ